jgi:hypothetical protein
MNATTIPFQTEIAREGWGWASDEFTRINFRRGRNMLRRIGLDTNSPDLAYLAWRTWQDVSKCWNAGRDDEDYLAVGEITDAISDHEAELLVELEPGLRRWWAEGIGGMTPEVTAIHDCLLSVSASLVDRWQEQDEAAAHVSGS